MAHATILALLAGAAAAALPPARAPDAPVTALRHAGRSIEVPGRFVVRWSAGEGAPERAATVPLAWRPWGKGLRAEAEGDGWRATVTLAPAEGVRVAVEARVRWSRDALVSKEAVVLELEGPATAVGRDLGWGPLTKALRVDRGTPAVLATGTALLDASGFVAARFEPRADGSIVDAELVLDDAGAHPFRALETCLEKRGDETDPDALAARFAALERNAIALDRTARVPGDVSHGAAQLWLLDENEPAPAPVIVERWARGARAAVVFTDHADRTDPPALRAVLYGTSDREDPRYGRGGFTGNGIRLTKSFFARGGRGSLLDDPEAAALADELAATGSDVSPHSISPGRDARAAVEDGLGRFRRWGANTWIDHQPYTNCEAVASLGWSDDGEFGLRDLLLAHRYRWVWDMNDVSGYTALANVFTVTPHGDPAPPIYPLPVDGRIWAFRSTWFFDAPGRLAAAMSETALDRLERERGLFVGHTYLSATHRTTRAPDLAARLLVAAQPDGSYDLDARFDAALSRLGTRVQAGMISSLTWREAGERLRQLEHVEITYLPDGRIAVENCGDGTIEGLTLAVPASLDLSVHGVPMFGLRPGRGRTTVWFDLPPATRVHLSASRHGRPAPFLRVPEAPLVFAR